MAEGEISIFFCIKNAEKLIKITVLLLSTYTFLSEKIKIASKKFLRLIVKGM